MSVRHLFCLALSTCLIFLGCEGPRDRRKVKVGTSPTNSTSGQNNLSGGAYSGGGVNFNTTGGSGTSPSTTTNNTGNTTPNSSLPPELAHCSTSTQVYAHYHSLVGEFNICKSNETNARKIIYQSKNGITDYRICIFPTNNDSGDSSVMIGNAQCFFANAQRVEILEFNLNRQGFTNRRLSGVLIVKDMPYGEVTPYHNNMAQNPPTYTMAYEDCMVYLYNTGDSFACQRFKEKGNYVYVSF